MSQDISAILKQWPYDEEGENLRKIPGDDGREKLQIRVCIDSYHGLLQLDCDGRPDGRRPHDCQFALDHYEKQARGQSDFRLSHEAAEELFAESRMTYHRYVIMLQMGDYDRVIRDTERNMRLFEFVHTRAAEEEDSGQLQKWWPYILRIHGTARALKLAAAQRFGEAVSVVRQTRDRIRGLEEQDDEAFRSERKRSLKALAQLARAIDKQRPRGEVETLEKQKEDAIAREDYERAALLRDQIADLRKQTGEGNRTGRGA